MQSDTSPFGLRGFLIDAPQFGALRGRPNGAVLIDNGKISKIGDYDDLRRLHSNSIRWLDRRPAAIFPGLIDCHTHLPQYSVVARGESELLPWLRQHIFPAEKGALNFVARERAPLSKMASVRGRPARVRVQSPFRRYLFGKNDA